MSKAEEKRKEQAEAIDRLRKMLRPGDTVYTICKSVSRSGMFRRIQVLIGKGREVCDITWLVDRAVGGWSMKDGALGVSGCGMDMGFHVVYTLSRVVFAKGFRCTGCSEWGGKRPRCPSNDHNNEREKNYAKGRIHSDSSYALRHSWL